MRKYLIVCLLAALGLLGLTAGCASSLARTGAVHEFNLTARQFAFDPGELRVKKGERVRIVVRSTDVTHGFAISEYRINRQIPPGEPVTIEFMANKPGRFVIYCTVFCGTDHAGHKGVLVVEG